MLAAGGTVATAAVWAVLQGLDGIALKQTVDAWVAASGSEKATLFSDAETVRWLEWGFQSYFRVLFGLSLLAVGAAFLVGRSPLGWVGAVAVFAGLISVVIGIDVGYSGLESGLQDTLSIVFQVVVLVFVVGVLLSGAGQKPRPAASAA
jgi:hypothetical protein